MRFRRARIRNFKLLRDVDVTFSTALSQSLTVIRAENESGKTSMLTALMWALYGTAGLEDSRVRLSPAYWAEGEDCEVSVEIDFDRILHSHIGGKIKQSEEPYRLVRSVVETVRSAGVEKAPERLALFRITDKGAFPVASPEMLVDQMLPPEMRDIFFTDGDRAMSFISSQLTRSTRRDQVRDALKSLLGLGLLDATSRHLREAESRLRREIGRSSPTDELQGVATKLERVEHEQERLEDESQQATKAIESLTTKVEAAERALEAALVLGNFEELSRRRERARQRLGEIARQEDRNKKLHRAAFSRESLSWGLIDAHLRKGSEALNSLQLKGVIPKASIPVLEDRISLQTCICGASLSPGQPARAKVEELMSSMRAVDAEKQSLTRLLHTTRSKIQERDAGNHDWLRDFEAVESARVQALNAREEAEREMAFCEERLRQIDHAEIEDKKNQRNALRSAVAQHQERKRGCDIRLSDLAGQVAQLKERFQALTKTSKKLRQMTARMNVTHDVFQIVSSATEQLQGSYLRQVSDRMNQLFMDLVGADPDSSSILRAARITPEYEIEVLTFDGRTLDPDHELNGASKRALTFAFIWALTEVSGVTAPRMIDTPLGMMSGAVKRRALEMMSAAAGNAPVNGIPPQVVLFLTRSEILHTEDVLDSRAGRVMTFTNSAHYPKDLVNPPGVDEPQMIVCECTHRQVCHLCQRRDDEMYDFTVRSQV